jgi:PDZ domain-containing protein
VAGRTVTLLVAAVLAIALFVVGWLLPVPYVILSPGPTQDTLGHLPNSAQPLISIRGRPTYPTTGQLRMLTVLLTGGPGEQPSLLGALQAWANHQDAIIPQEFEFPPGQSSNQVVQQDLQQMQQSQLDAITAALSLLRIPGQVVVQSVSPGTPAARVLQPGDTLLSLNGRPLDQVTQLLDAVRASPPGTSLRLTVRRGRRTLSLRVGTARQDGETIIGIVPEERPDPPLSIRIDLQNVGGPSAGMMFALGIIDKLSPAGLTGGRSIAGTGTMDFAGDVGPIGGIQQKVFAAAQAGATVFLAPSSECAAAQQVAPRRLRVIPVNTLSGAVAALKALSNGGRVPRC